MALASLAYRHLRPTVAFLSHVQPEVDCSQVIEYVFIVGGQVQGEPTGAQQRAPPRYRQNPTSVIGMVVPLAGSDH
jgi:hypothetical protein